MPSELWTEYFEKRFHEHLPQIQYESDLYSGSVVPLSKMSMERPEIAEDHFSPTCGYRGVYDRGVRLEQMDREGIAAEFVYHGDLRVGDLAHNVTNSVWPFDQLELNGGAGFVSSMVRQVAPHRSGAPSGRFRRNHPRCDARHNHLDPTAARTPSRPFGSMGPHGVAFGGSIDQIAARR
jgi:hypothetical protein